MRIELRGIELHGYHGVLDDERRDGQRFLFDVELERRRGGGGERPDRGRGRLPRRRCSVREVSDQRAHRLLESLAAAVADELLARFPARSVSVRVRKPDVRLDPPVEVAAVSVERHRA